MHASGHRELHGVAWSGARTGMAWSICWLFILISVGSSEPGASAPITGIAIVDILHNDVVLTRVRSYNSFGEFSFMYVKCVLRWRWGL